MRQEATHATTSRMAPTDALFWYAEDALPIFRPIIAGLYVLESEPDPARIEAGTDAAIALVPRLRQRVVEAPLQLGLPEWVEDAHFDREYHVRHLSLPGPGRMRQLLDLAADFFATPLDRERPLWEAYWIEGLEGGRAAYFFKMHHSLVDGVGSITILDALTQRSRDEAPPDLTAPPARRPRRGLAGRLVGLAADNARTSVETALEVASASAGLVAHPLDSATRAASTLRGLRGLAADLVRSPVRDPLAGDSSGLSRRLEVTQISLERLRKIKAPLGVTINDLVLAALAGTLAAYHRERGVEAEVLHCMVPMNLRGRDERDALGNRVGVFNVDLPVGDHTLRERLERIAAQTRAAKRDQRGASMPFLVRALPLVPGPAFRWIARQSLGRANVACTNIPGVKRPRYMAGARVEAIYPFASVVEGTPLVVALLSYAGTVDIGIDSDPESIPQPARLTELFHESLDELEALAGC